MAFYRGVLATTGQMKNIRTVIATDRLEHWPDELSEGLEIWEQGPGILGERLPRVLSRALKDSTFAMALGADCPDLTVEHLTKSLRYLEDADAVVSPAQDGGYHLLGVREGVNVDLTRVRMGSSHAFDDTVKAIQQSGFSWRLGPAGFDVDTPRIFID